MLQIYNVAQGLFVILPRLCHVCHDFTLSLLIRLKQHTSFEIVSVIEFSHTACYSLLSGYFFLSLIIFKTGKKPNMSCYPICVSSEYSSK